MWWPYGAVAAILMIGFLVSCFPVFRYRGNWLPGIVYNGLAFLLAYGLVNQSKPLVFWKFTLYLIVSVGIDCFFYTINGMEFQRILRQCTVDYHLPSHFLFFLVFSMLPFLLFVVWNTVTLKLLFQTDTRTAIRMGALLGITNATALFAGLPGYL